MPAKRELLAILSLLLLVSVVGGDVLYVDVTQPPALTTCNTPSSSCSSFSNALAFAQDGDTILLLCPAGAIVLFNETNISIPPLSLSITSADCTLEASSYLQQSVSTQQPIFTLSIGSTVTFSNFSFSKFTQRIITGPVAPSSPPQRNSTFSKLENITFSNNKNQVLHFVTSLDTVIEYSYIGIHNCTAIGVDGTSQTNSPGPFHIDVAGFAEVDVYQVNITRTFFGIRSICANTTVGFSSFQYIGSASSSANALSLQSCRKSRTLPSVTYSYSKVYNSTFINNKSLGAIYAGMATNAASYTHEIFISGCMFEVPLATDSAKYIQAVSYNFEHSLELKDCRFTRGKNSALYSQRLRRLIIQNSVFEDMTSGGDQILKFVQVTSGTFVPTDVQIIDSSFLRLKDKVIDALSVPGTFTIKGCTFRDIKSATVVPTGAVVGITDNTAVTVIEDTVFESITGRSAVLYLRGQSATISNSKFYDVMNSETNGGAIENFTLKTIIDSCEFINTTAALSGGAIIDRSFVEDQFFKNQVSDRAYVSCLFKNTTALSGYGGAIASLTINRLDMQTSQFYDSTSNSGGAIYWLGDIGIFRSRFERCRALKNDGGAIKAVRTLAALGVNYYSGCSAKAYGGAVSLSDVTEYIQYFDKNNPELFIENTASYGGALSIINDPRDTLSSAATIQINHVHFLNNSASTSGGAIHIQGTTLIIDIAELRNNTAPKGGAIFGMQATLQLVAPLLAKQNSADYGGFSYTDYLTSIHKANQILLIDNTASIAGGTMFLSAAEGVKKALTILPLAFTINGSSALYGQIMATPPYYIGADRIVMNEASETTVITFENETKRIELFLGQVFSIQFHLEDMLNSTIFNVNDVFVLRVSLRGNGILIGNVEATLPIKSNVGSFEGIRILGNAGDTGQLVVNLVGSEVSTTVPYILTTCKAGYFEKEDALGGSLCEECKGSYALRANSTTCNSCPSNAECNLDRVLPHEGYWAYINLQSDVVQVYKCPFQRCLKANNCKGPRDATAPLCGACLEGYSDWNNSCVKCNEAVNAGFLILFILFQLVVFLFTHLKSQTASKNGITKIIFFFAQNVTLIIDNSKWVIIPKILFDFELPFIANDDDQGSTSSSSAGSLSSIPCPFQRDAYGKMLTSALQPLLLFLFLLVTFVIFLTISNVCWCIKKRKKSNAEIPTTTETPPAEQELSASSPADSSLAPTPSETPSTERAEGQTLQSTAVVQPAAKKKVGFTKKLFLSLKNSLVSSFAKPQAYVMTFVSLLIYTYQQFAKVGLSFFTCKKVGDKFYLLSSTNVVCFEGLHLKWLVLYAFLVLYAILFPIILVVVLVLIRKRKKSLDSTLGILYLTYKPNYYYYESIALLRRTFIIIALMVSEYASPGDLSLLILVFLVSLVIQKIYQPYNTAVENTAEELSLVILITLVFLKDSLSVVGLIVLILVLVFFGLQLVVSYLLSVKVVEMILKKIKNTILKTSSEATKRRAIKATK